MLFLMVLVLLSGVCIGGWRYGKRSARFDYRQLDTEMEALRRAIEEDKE